MSYRVSTKKQIDRNDKYEIDSVESEMLRMIDDMTIHKGYGPYRMADFLNKNGYAPSGGGKFTSIKVIRILRDPFYCGRLADGTTSPQLEALRLRSDDTDDLSGGQGG